MKAFFVFLVVVIAIFFLTILFFALKSHKFFKTLFFNAVLGIGVLAIINLTTNYTNIFIPVNWYSVVGSGVFGIPAVSFFLILQIIF